MRRNLRHRRHVAGIAHANRARHGFGFRRFAGLDLPGRPEAPHPAAVLLKLLHARLVLLERVVRLVGVEFAGVLAADGRRLRHPHPHALPLRDPDPHRAVLARFEEVRAVVVVHAPEAQLAHAFIERERDHPGRLRLEGFLRPEIEDRFDRIPHRLRNLRVDLAHHDRDLRVLQILVVVGKPVFPRDLEAVRRMDVKEPIGASLRDEQRGRRVHPDLPRRIPVRRQLHRRGVRSDDRDLARPGRSDERRAPPMRFGSARHVNRHQSLRNDVGGQPVAVRVVDVGRAGRVARHRRVGRVEDHVAAR